jgi:hypothetical protein
MEQRRWKRIWTLSPPPQNGRKNGQRFEEVFFVRRKRKDKILLDNSWLKRYNAKGIRENPLIRLISTSVW